MLDWDLAQDAETQSEQDSETQSEDAPGGGRGRAPSGWSQAEWEAAAEDEATARPSTTRGRAAVPPSAPAGKLCHGFAVYVNSLQLSTHPAFTVADRRELLDGASTPVRSEQLSPTVRPCLSHTTGANCHTLHVVHLIKAVFLCLMISLRLIIARGIVWWNQSAYTIRPRTTAPIWWQVHRLYFSCRSCMGQLNAVRARPPA